MKKIKFKLCKLILERFWSMCQNGQRHIYMPDIAWLCKLFGVYRFDMYEALREDGFHLYNVKVVQA